ncbi:MAG TPA: hypothetical protein VL129_00850 [Pseudomonas sp.]|uniref:hypothetical protein n=1 Tax=Pseudomonas sp. TaxID=306 RepID=UPI002BA1D773|nr:hypothetical protein [Pseudomonas sp.]HTO17685.1 hypothetical protein [Pseudomonas sp.]
MKPAAPPPAPPSKPPRVVTYTKRIDVRQIRLCDGDVLVLPAGTPREEILRFGEALKAAHAGKRCYLVSGDISMIPEAEMNAAGWYRK